MDYDNLILKVFGKGQKERLVPFSHDLRKRGIQSHLIFAGFGVASRVGGSGVPRRANGLTTDRLKELAKAGAETALKQLRAEIIAIERTFPELKLPATRRRVARSIRRVEQRGRQMSSAARKAVSARMKKYWAERRKAKAKVK